MYRKGSFSVQSWFLEAGWVVEIRTHRLFFLSVQTPEQEKDYFRYKNSVGEATNDIGGVRGINPTLEELLQVVDEIERLALSKGELGNC